MRSKTGLNPRRRGPLLLCPTPRGPPPLPPRFVPTWAYLVAAHWVTWFLPRTNLPRRGGNRSTRISKLSAAAPIWRYSQQRGDAAVALEWNSAKIQSPAGSTSPNEKGRSLESCGSSLHPWEWHGSPTALPKEAEGADYFIARASLSGEIVRRESNKIMSTPHKGDAFIKILWFALPSLENVRADRAVWCNVWLGFRYD